MLQAWIIILDTHVGILNADRGAFDYHSISCSHNRITHWDVLDLSVLWTQVLVCVLFFLAETRVDTEKCTERVDKDVPNFPDASLD